MSIRTLLTDNNKIINAKKFLQNGVSLPDVNSMVKKTDDPLTNNKIILGNGTNEIKSSDVILDNIVSKTEDPLTNNKIIIGDNENIIKNSLISTNNTGSIDLPINQSYSINNQNVIYQNEGTYKGELNNIQLFDDNNQIILGSVNKTTLTSTPSSNRIFNIPDLPNSNFIMSEGNQNINGVKQFTDEPIFNSGVNLGIGQEYQINNVSVLNSTNLGNSIANSFITTNTGNLVNNGTISSTLTIESRAPSNQIALRPNGIGSTIFINSASVSGNKVYEIIDCGVNSSFIMADGLQTLKGKTMEDVKNITMSTDATLKTNKILSNGANDIVIDSENRILFNTVSNNGAIFTGNGSLVNWAIKTAPDMVNGSSECCVMGNLPINGQANCATIGSNNNSSTLWTPLYIQPNSHVIIGETLKTVAQNNKLWVDGTTHSTTGLTTDGNMIIKKNGVNGLTLTTTTTMTSPVEAKFLPSGGTVCYTNQRLITLPFTEDFTTASTSFVKVCRFIIPNNIDFVFGGSNFYIEHNTTNTDTLVYRLQNITDGTTLLSSSTIGDATTKIVSHSTFQVYPLDNSAIELQVLLTGGSTIIKSASIQL